MRSTSAVDRYLARALALLAAPGAGALLDPLCGSGTIVVKARLARPEAEAAGVDVEPGAIAAATLNADAAGVSAAFRVADAGGLPIGAGTLDAVATNPPWGLRVSAAGALRGGFDRFWAELARVLADEGRAVVLLPGATRVPGRAGLEVVERTAVRVAGRLADVVVLERRHS